jgi:hypothetical protein
MIRSYRAWPLDSGHYYVSYFYGVNRQPIKLELLCDLKALVGLKHVLHVKKNTVLPETWQFQQPHRL